MQHAGLVARFPSACALGIATAFFSIALCDTVFAAFIRFYSFLQCSFCQLAKLHLLLSWLRLLGMATEVILPQSITNESFAHL